MRRHNEKTEEEEEEEDRTLFLNRREAQVLD